MFLVPYQVRKTYGLITFSYQHKNHNFMWTFCGVFDDMPASGRDKFGMIRSIGISLKQKDAKLLYLPRNVLE